METLTIHKTGSQGRYRTTWADRETQITITQNKILSTRAKTVSENQNRTVKLGKSRTNRKTEQIIVKYVHNIRTKFKVRETDILS